MARLIQVILLFSLILALGCIGSPLRWIAADDPELLDWTANFEETPEVSFEPVGIASWGDRLYIYGCFKTPSFVARSFLLESINGGKKWAEVGVPYEGACIEALRFPDAKTGYALVAWETEGPGPLYLMGTKDGGENWLRLSEIPKDHYSGRPTQFQFKNADEGYLMMEYMDDSQAGLRPMVMTLDGGRSWTPFETLPTSEDAEAKLTGPKPYSTIDATGRKLTFNKTSQGWELKNSAGGEPLFVFSDRVALEKIAAIETENCGCPNQEVRKKMLK